VPPRRRLPAGAEQLTSSLDESSTWLGSRRRPAGAPTASGVARGLFCGACALSTRLGQRSRMSLDGARERAPKNDREVLVELGSCIVGEVVALPRPRDDVCERANTKRERERVRESMAPRLEVGIG